MGRQVVSADVQPHSVKAATLTVAAELTGEDPTTVDMMRSNILDLCSRISLRGFTRFLLFTYNQTHKVVFNIAGRHI